MIPMNKENHHGQAGAKAPRAVSVRRNTLANYAGTLSQAFLGFLFIPLYIKYLGIESYGLVGFSVSLGAVLRLADLGMSSTLSREFARLSTAPDSVERMRGLLKTMQAVYWGISLLLGVVMIAAAPVIAGRWINAGSIDAATVKNAVLLMGLTALAQGVISLYLGGVFGLQRHSLGNLINVILAVLRYGGAVAALALISPTIETFFAYQLGVASIGALAAGILLWRLLPRASVPSRFQPARLKPVWRFAAGMSVNSALWLALSQMDKIILIKVLPLRVFGYYAVAATAASAVSYLGGPLYTTFLPRYTQLYAAGDEARLRATYRISSRLNALIIVPAVVFLALFSREALLAWTRDPAIAANAHVFLSLLAIGNGLNQLAYLSSALQVAAGWVRLGIYANAAGVVFIVPALVIATRWYGGVGAAAAWIALSFGFILIYVNLLHARVLKGEARQWYAGIQWPLVFALGIGVAGRYLLSAAAGIGLAASVGVLWIIAVVASMLTASDLRERLAALMIRG